MCSGQCLIVASLSSIISDVVCPRLWSNALDVQLDLLDMVFENVPESRDWFSVGMLCMLLRGLPVCGVRRRSQEDYI